jgi:hypothetical protein
MSGTNYYYLGDPCYVIHDDEWSDFCKGMMAEGGKKNQVGYPHYFQWRGRGMHFINTGGDGMWDGLCVDAGVLSCIPVEVCDPEKLKEKSTCWRIIDKCVQLSMQDRGSILLIDDEPTDGAEYCQCSYCGGSGELLSEEMQSFCYICWDGPYDEGCIGVHEGEYICEYCESEIKEEEE